jgi:hypothetical protein
MQSGMITRVDIAEGSALVMGSKLLEVRVDLSGAAPQDCPPIFYFRVVSNERGWVRRLSASVGEEKGVGEVLALVSTGPDEPLDGPPARSLRVSNAAVLPELDWPT